jgi:hypothetical protein
MYQTFHCSGLTAAQWREQNSNHRGNVRDEADMAQLVCLSNLENLNALFIAQNLTQSDRLQRLNKIAIQQMTLLTADDRIKRLGGGTK